jgi:hypothetical protein
MKTKYIEETIAYTGEQLRSNFAYTEFNIIGDSIIAFCGACDIPLEKMVDLEDVKDNSRIYSESMVHFIVEHHDSDLEKAVLRQLMLATIIYEVLNENQADLCIKRLGSDLYDHDAKLSISIATLTPLSSLIHFGVNISSDNTPVKTKGLKDYGIDPHDFAKSVMAKYKEMESEILIARCKVRWRE